jgi:putative colanic acid biosynthesis acetyltransferase WcaF
MPVDSGRSSNVFQQLDKVNPRPYTAREYAIRFAWQITAMLFFRTSPTRFFGWRRFLLRLFGANLQNTSIVRKTCSIMHPWLLTMGEFSTIGDRVSVYNLGPISIGNHTAVSQDAELCAGSHDYTKPNLPLTRPPITIGSGVWVCAGAFIGPGVTVGDNSIVGARSVVMKDVPPGVIVAGNPAVVVKQRPTETS